jgi:peptide/nickel transport system ATP-binding protein
MKEKTKRLNPIDGLMPDPTQLPEGCKFHPRCPHCSEKCVKGEILVAQKGIHAIRCVLYGGVNI